MDIKERQDLRLSLLKELYNLYFDKNKRSFIDIDSDVLKKDDFEKYRAYDYILSKGLIKDIRKGGNIAQYQIAICGIDLIEALELKKQTE